MVKRVPVTTKQFDTIPLHHHSAGQWNSPCSSWSSPQPLRATTSTWALAAPVATLPFAYRGRWIQQKWWKPTRKLLPYWGYDEIYNEIYWDLSIQVNYIHLYTIIYILLYDVQRLRNPALKNCGASWVSCVATPSGNLTWRCIQSQLLSGKYSVIIALN